jgi:carbonyl reductase 1
MSSAKQQRVILVTGGNRGIGFEVVKKFVEESGQSNNVILLGCRDLKRGEDALVRLGSPSNVHLLELDTSSSKSITQATEQIKEKYGGQLDVIINNAAVVLLGTNIDDARKSFAINYYGVKLLNESLFPLIRENGRVVNVVSAGGAWILHEASKDLQEKFCSPSLTIEQLDRLVEDFISAAENNSLGKIGYMVEVPAQSYLVSKTAVIALTRVEAREWSKVKNVLVFSVCPGGCITDANQSPGMRHASFGADSILHPVNAPQNELENGALYRDGEMLPQIHMNREIFDHWIEYDEKLQDSAANKN